MPDQKPLTILCVTSYEKGQEFIRTSKAMGCPVLLLTVEKLKDGDFPREAQILNDQGKVNEAELEAQSEKNKKKATPTHQESGTATLEGQ